jgi:hypothetical protein
MGSFREEATMIAQWVIAQGVIVWVITPSNTACMNSSIRLLTVETVGIVMIVDNSTPANTLVTSAAAVTAAAAVSTAAAVVAAAAAAAAAKTRALKHPARWKVT